MREPKRRMMAARRAKLVRLLLSFNGGFETSLSDADLISNKHDNPRIKVAIACAREIEALFAGRQALEKRNG